MNYGHRTLQSSGEQPYRGRAVCGGRFPSPDDAAILRGGPGAAALPQRLHLPPLSPPSTPPQPPGPRQPENV